MAMDILAYTFAIIALVAGIKCFADETWGEDIQQESDDAEDPVMDDKKIA